MLNPMYSKSLRLLVALFVICTAPVLAQEPISADNFERLTPVTEINFDQLPVQVGTILNGRAYVDAAGAHVAVVNRDGQIVIFDSQGNLLAVTEPILTEDGFPATFIDGAFARDAPYFVAIYSGGDRFYLTVTQLDGTRHVAAHQSPARPVAIWSDRGEVWLEMIPDDADTLPFLLRYALDDLAGPGETLPNVLSSDLQVVVRIGHLPLPLAVTAHEDGQVSRWNLEEGRRTHLDLLPEVPIYGDLTPDGLYLLWRDAASQALHVYDFDTAEEQVSVALNGIYIPFLHITPDGQLIIGVDVDELPLIAVWPVATGQRHDIGPYRQCGRAPDMVALSNDGSTLVIGCDSGIEFWKIR